MKFSKKISLSTKGKVKWNVRCAFANFMTWRGFVIGYCRLILSCPQSLGSAKAFFHSRDPTLEH